MTVSLLSERDREILEHVCRYRLTTRTALQRLYFSESHVNAVSKVTTRLCRHGFLGRYPLYARNYYFVLGSRAVKLLGLPRSRTESLGTQALPREYATLLYCSQSALTKERLTSDEFSVHFSGYQLDGIENSHYVVEQDGAERRLSFLRVDYHGAADHVARKCKSDADIRLRSPKFSELIQSGRFMIVVATGGQEKSLAIRQALSKTTWPMGFRIHIAVIPELIHLLGR